MYTTYIQNTISTRYTHTYFDVQEVAVAVSISLYMCELGFGSGLVLRYILSLRITVIHSIYGKFHIYRPRHCYSDFSDM